jgi:uncharacterized cysteine cluster protein YcgN (CxxCxxCC family)
MFEGSDISCRAYDDDTCICPKSRNRFRITTACWRVKNNAAI